MKQRSSSAIALVLASLLVARPGVGQVPAPSPAPPAAPERAAPVGSSVGQQTAPPSTPQTQTPSSAPDDGDVVRITSNLVQIDVVVTDKKGKQVTDLTSDDFEILEDGRPQKITNFSYVSNVPTPTSPVVAVGGKAAPPDKNVSVPPPVRLRPEQVRRTIALVVDDLRSSFESVAFVRHALKKFVDEQLQPNDLVAVVRTSSGMGALQQFTSDRRQLHAAVERVKWYSQGSGGVSALAPLGGDGVELMGGQMNGRMDNQLRGRWPSPGRFGGFGEFGGLGGRDNEDRRVADDIDELREDVFTVGTLGALNFIVKGLRELPGRKSIVLFSDGFRMYDDDGMSGRILQAMRRLTDLANRASVIIYTIDPRGVVYTGLTAADNTTGMTAGQVRGALQSRSNILLETQSSMNILAEQTGGLSVRNNNDISGGLRRVLDDQRGYYLIGYRPDEATFDAARGRGKFHKITTKLKRPELKVRTRGGFYGFTETEAARPVAKLTRNQQLYAAVSSPFASGDVPLRLTSLFRNDDEKTSYLDSILHIDARGFTFTAEAEGWHKAEVDLVALTFGDGALPVDELNRTVSLRLRGETYQRVLKNGLIYSMRVPVKKPGAYQLRIAVRDAASERTGAASQFVEVPNLKKNRLALSGIVLMGSDTMAARIAASQQTEAEGAAAGAAKEGQVNEPDPSGSPALRRFRPGASIDYLYSIYNARLDRATRRPQLQTQLRLFREGRQVFAGEARPFDGSQQTDMNRLLDWSRLRLGTNLQPGEYALQVVVTDALAAEKRGTVTQWIDFEIVK